MADSRIYLVNSTVLHVKSGSALKSNVSEVINSFRKEKKDAEGWLERSECDYVWL